MNELSCTKLDIKKLTEQIFRVRIQPLAGEIFDFKGGQYLYLLMPDGKRIPLSIASPPEQKKYIELHIRLIPGHELAADMLHLFETAKRIHIEGPYGSCFLNQSADVNPNDIVIIAGGTGFSPMKSLLESALAQADKRKLSLYLGVQKAEELYQTELVNSWDLESCGFTYIPVVAEADKGWKGAVGYPHQIALTDIGQTVAKLDFYISGSEKMVMNVYKALLDAGADKECIYSDILDIKREMGESI